MAATPVAVLLPVAPVTTTWWVPKNLPSKNPVSTARLRIVAPAPAQVVGRSFTVELELFGGRIVPLSTTRNRPNQGHIHVAVTVEVRA